MAGFSGLSKNPKTEKHLNVVRASVVADFWALEVPGIVGKAIQQMPAWLRAFRSGMCVCVESSAGYVHSCS